VEITPVLHKFHAVDARPRFPGGAVYRLAVTTGLCGRLFVPTTAETHRCMAGCLVCVLDPRHGTSRVLFFVAELNVSEFALPLGHVLCMDLWTMVVALLATLLAMLPRGRLFDHVVSAMIWVSTMVGMVAGALVVVMASAVPIVLVPNQVAHDVAETHSGVQLVRNGRSMLVPPTIRDRIQGLSRPAPALVVNAVSLMSAVIVPVPW